MNERIRELMGKTLDDKFSHTWTTMTYKDLEKFSEKFAELIVQECAEQVDWILAEGGKTQGDMLKEHFGVEE